MAVTHVFAGIPVAHRDAAVGLYERLAGRPPDLIPNVDEAAWRLSETGWIYMVADAALQTTCCCYLQNPSNAKRAAFQTICPDAALSCTSQTLLLADARLAGASTANSPQWGLCVDLLKSRRI